MAATTVLNFNIPPNKDYEARRAFEDANRRCNDSSSLQSPRLAMTRPACGSGDNSAESLSCGDLLRYNPYPNSITNADYAVVPEKACRKKRARDDSWSPSVLCSTESSSADAIPFKRRNTAPTTDDCNSNIQADRFEFGKWLGKGGFACVRAVRDRATDRTYALKVFKPSDDADIEADEEMRMATVARGGVQDTSALFLARYYECTFLPGGEASILMELCVGSLTTAISMGCADGWERKREWMRQLATAIAHMHANGVGHFDIKPDNILVASDGSIRVTDFNRARPCRQYQNIRHGLCRHYAPQEYNCAGARFVCLAADVCAMGCVLLELYGESFYDIVGPEEDWNEQYAQQADDLTDMRTLTQHIAKRIHESDEDIKLDVIAVALAALSPVGVRVDAATLRNLLSITKVARVAAA